MRQFIKLQLALCLVFLTSCQSQPQQVGWKLGDVMIAGKMTLAAHSDIVYSTSENQSIFGGAKRSVLAFACEDKKEHLIMVMHPPTLLDAMNDGKKTMTVRMTIDDEASQAELLKHTSHPGLIFEENSPVVDKLTSASSIKLELSLLKGEQLSFEFELKDAEKMIQKTRIESC